MWFVPPFLSSPASAAALEAPLIELLSVGDVVGDGQTPVTLHLLVLDADARPYQGCLLYTSDAADE